VNDKEKAAFDELDSYFSKYHCLNEAWQTMKAAVLAQQTTNKQMDKIKSPCDRIKLCRNFKLHACSTCVHKDPANSGSWYEAI